MRPSMDVAWTESRQPKDQITRIAHRNPKQTRNLLRHAKTASMAVAQTTACLRKAHFKTAALTTHAE